MNIRYQLVDRIGSTAGSHLYRAQSLQGGAAAVLKVLDPDHVTPAQTARLRREYEILKGLDLPGVVKPLELIEHDPPMIVLDCPAGELLENVLTRDRLDLPTCLRLSSQLATILAGLHGARITHRDLRPANLMLTPKDEVCLLDLSLAAFEPPETAVADIPSAADWAYISPEQTGRMNRAVDYRTDFYSLGVTLYRMLTGQLPFQGSDALEWVHCHIARQPRPPVELCQGLPQVVSDIVMKLLAKTAEDRYQSASGLHYDLERSLRQWETSGAILPFPLAGRDVSERFQIPQKLYGREAEVARLVEAFDRMATSGEPALVQVYGYSGIGKSALVYELNQPVVREGGYFISGKFDQYLRDIPYASISQAFRELVQQILAESDERVIVWRKRLQETLTGNGQVAVDLIPQLSLILGAQPPLPALPPTEARERFHMVFRKFIGVFAKKEHPLVIFLDDLQWVDSASLKLLEHLITHPDTRYLLLIVAYRDNEVGETHPLPASLKRIRGSAAKVVDIKLGPLPPVQLNQLLADTLRAERASCEPLTRLVYERTEGNPFFFTRFLAALHEEGLVQWEAGNRSWQWDLDKISAKEFADNAAELMAGKLRRLPVPARESLSLASCLGSKFDRSSLALVGRHPKSETEQRLALAIHEHLVICMDGDCKFMHDRIQQAAYSLIPEAERAAVHLRIGRLLSTHVTPEELEERIFEIVGHFDHGAPLLTAPEERVRVAELNLIAGKRAKAGTAYHSALDFFSAGIGLLGKDPWEQRELAWELFFERAECEFLLRRFDKSLRQFDALLTRSESKLEKARVFRVVVDIHTTTVEIDEAIACGLAALSLFGIDIPRHPTDEQVAAEYDTIWKSLGGRRIEDLIDWSIMSDPEMQAAMSILVILFAPSIAADRNLLILCACHMVNMAIRYGNSDAAVMAYGYLGMNLGPFFGKYREGFRFGALGCDLVEKRGLTAYRAKIYFIIGAFIDFWNQPAAKGIEHLGAALKAAGEAGDLNIGSYACDHLVSHRLVSGEPLDAVYLASEELLDFTRRAKFDPSSQIIIRTQRFIEAMQGRTDHVSSFGGADFDQAAYEEFMDSYGWISIICGYYVMKLQLLVICGDFAAAVAAGAKVKTLLWSNLGMIQEAEYVFYYALALAGHYPRVTPELQAAYMQDLITFRKKLEQWSDNCPENFLNRYSLVAAEIARLEWREPDAMRLYQQAIRSARENDFVQNEALAYEIASSFYRARGFDLFADTYLREAHSCYGRWGASGKVRALEARHPGLMESARLHPSAGIGEAVEHLDVVTVVKASQAVSGEIVHSRLIETLMTIAVEHAGAERGLLLLPEGQGFRIAAEAVTGADQVLVSLCQTPVMPIELPTSALRYVLRTRESVILDDATIAAPFRDDEYVRSRRPKSMLLLPLVKQTRLVGALYLENSLIPGAFTADRVRLLDLLASQAVISLENAELYADLKEREARIRRLVESNIIGILFFDLAGNITEANEAFLAMVGYSREDVLSGKVRWNDMTPPEWSHLDEQAVKDLRSTGRSKTFEKEYIRSDGSRVPIVVAGAMLEGSSDLGIAFVLDLTDRKRAEEALRKAHEELEQKVVERTRQLSDANARLKELDHLKSMFIALMSHELRTPLNSVIGFSSILLEEWIGPLNDEQKESLDTILRSGKHLLSLINDVIDVSKIEAGMIELQVEEFDIADGLSEAVQTFTKEIQDKGLELRVDSVRQTVFADRRRLLQSLLNLISNAVKFTEKGTIAIVASAVGAAPADRPEEGAGLPTPEQNAFIEISVTDTGVGIREEDQPKLFAPFVRLDSPLRTKVTGTGLGLYLTKKLVSEALRGTIRCQSKYEEGSTFTIRMPVRIVIPP